MKDFEINMGKMPVSGISRGYDDLMRETLESYTEEYISQQSASLSEQVQIDEELSMDKRPVMIGLSPAVAITLPGFSDQNSVDK